jgi:hypothetical protein
MKNVIAIVSGVVFAISLVGTASAANLQASGKQDMQMPRPESQNLSNAQNACNTKYPSFSRLDAKHRGYLTKKEASQVPGLVQAFKKADTNHNGKLSDSEYTGWVESQCKSMSNHQPQGQMPPPPV